MAEALTMDSLNDEKESQEDIDEGLESKKSANQKKADPTEQIQEMTQQTQGLSEAINLGVSTWGWSEIGRILLRILCNIIPAMEKIGKLNPKLKFYFSAIDMGKMIDLAQLLEFVLLVVIWGTVIVALVVLIAIIAHCLSGVSEALQCASEVVGAVI